MVGWLCAGVIFLKKWWSSFHQFSKYYLNFMSFCCHLMSSIMQRSGLPTARKAASSLLSGIWYACKKGSQFSVLEELCMFLSVGWISSLCGKCRRWTWELDQENFSRFKSKSLEYVDLGNYINGFGIACHHEHIRFFEQTSFGWCRCASRGEKKARDWDIWSDHDVWQGLKCQFG